MTMFRFSGMRRAWPGAFCFVAAGSARAAQVAAPPPALPSAGGSLLTVILGLAVVLGMIVAVAWLFKRLSGGVLGMSSRVRVMGGAMVGPKERVVIVEVEGEWLVLGVTAQQVNLLNKLPKPETADAEPAQAAEPFARWMKSALDKSRTLGKRGEE